MPLLRQRRTLVTLAFWFRVQTIRFPFWDVLRGLNASAFRQLNVTINLLLDVGECPLP